MLYLRPRMIALLALGFASGLPLALTASTLSVWLTEAGVTKAAIGLFAAVATPYAFKFLWAPLVDTLPFPLLTRALGRRRGWLIGTQGLLAAAVVALGVADPASNAWATAWCALLVAILSATQDIVIDAYRVELLPPQEQGAGAAMAVLGYRFGMIASSAGALYLATYFGWQTTYFVMALLLGVGAIAALLAGEPQDGTLLQREARADWLRTAIIAPFADFMRRPQWLAILLFIFLYKFGDAFIGVMTNPFLIEIGFSKTDIAEVVKLYGLGATIAGGFLGGWIVSRFGIMKPLWLGGLLHALTNLMFVVQARVGADIHVLALGITLENFTGGVSTAALVAYLSSLCNVRFTATQYALLSSLAAAARTLFSTPAGLAAELMGWEVFFAFSASLAIPGLLMLYVINRGTYAQKAT